MDRFNSFEEFRAFCEEHYGSSPEPAPYVTAYIFDGGSIDLLRETPDFLAETRQVARDG
jgi:hypothetical protein